MNNNKIISDVFNLKDIFNILNAVVDECRIYISEDGWKISTLDPANVSSVALDIPDENFKDYHIEKPFIVELETLEILKILEDKEDYQPVEITMESISEDNAEKYKIKFNFGRIVHSFISNKIGADKKTIPVSTKDNVNISISLDHFRDIIKSCSYISDYISFESKDNNIWVHSEGGNGRSVEAFIEGDITGRIKSTFSLDYLQDIAKRIDNGNNTVINIHLGIDWPMTIKFNVCKHGKGIYVLAPRVDSEI